MGSELRVIIYPPDAQGGRRVRVDGKILGAALGPGNLLEFLRRAGLDPDDVHPKAWRTAPSDPTASTAHRGVGRGHGDAAPVQLAGRMEPRIPVRCAGERPTT
ncbi:hypothetical protein [Streptomyces sp. NPDC085665]|uniref:hypothetical protein n=1 Tax=Streptomyces sp. NPDC085665 TaxID=3365735 RepID=UPI0037CCD8CD